MITHDHTHTHTHTIVPPSLSANPPARRGTTPECDRDNRSDLDGADGGGGGGVRMEICKQTSVCMYMCMCMCAFACVYVCACVYARVCMRIRICMCVCRDNEDNVYMQTAMYLSICTTVYAYLYVRMYT